LAATPRRPLRWGTGVIHASPRIATYLSYGVGMTGNQIMRDVPTAMLLFYMTNTLLIPAAFAGLAILLPKIWVVFADPLVGAWSDRTRSRWGARKPFLFWGSIGGCARIVGVVRRRAGGAETAQCMGAALFPAAGAGGRLRVGLAPDRRHRSGDAGYIARNEPITA
jgi:hypothetical protein